MAQVSYNNVFFFETILAFRRLWVKEPRHSENMLAEMCYLYYRRMRPSLPHRVKTSFLDQAHTGSFFGPLTTAAVAVTTQLRPKGHRDAQRC